MIAMLFLTLLAVMAIEAFCILCIQPQSQLTYTVVLYSVDKPSFHKTIEVPRSKCMLREDLTHNRITSIDTNNVVFCVYFYDRCEGTFEHFYSSLSDGAKGKTLAGRLYGSVYSLKYCGDWSMHGLYWRSYLQYNGLQYKLAEEFLINF